MDTPPIPKPRSAFLPQNDPLKQPVPLPRTKVPPNDRGSASEILRSISSVSKQLTEDVASKLSSSAKSANEKIEKSIIDGSRFARGTLEKTITTSRAVRDSVTKSVIEGTRSAGLKLRRSTKPDSIEEPDQRCVSMPVVDVSLFDNIQFHSPLLEQKRYKNEDDTETADIPPLQLNARHLDDMSLFSNHSDTNTDTVSNFSHDSRELDDNSNEHLTYDTPKPSRTNSIVSFGSFPEIPERRKNRESVEVMRQNSMYENWTLPFQAKKENKTKDVELVTENTSRPSKSTIYEFDPLHKSSTSSKYQGVSNELLLLESFLTGDTYGTIVSNDTNDDKFNFDESDYFNPPTPPERFDSLFPEEKPTERVQNRDKNSNWFVSDSDSKSITEDETKQSNSVIQRFSRRLKLDNVLNKSTKQTLPKIEVVERPPVHTQPVPYFSGILMKIVSGVVEDLFKNSQSRYCVLSDQKLMCYTDPTNSILKEAYTLDNIYSIQIVLPLSSSTTSNSYCFELSVSSGGIRNTPRKILFSCASASERRHWAQKFVEHLTNNFSTNHTSEITRCGWCYLKEGVSGEWRGAWLILVRRVLVYTTKDSNVCTVDLRKTRCVVTQDADDESKQLCPADCSSNLLLDCPHTTLYLRFPHDRELKGWRYMIKLASYNNGSHIHHQQLTKEDVPAVVDKCLSFIYAHGSLTEGIYRRAGSSSVLSELLARFRRDSWSVQLSPGQHSEHDVAGVLKRFFRDLPESLIPKDNHQVLIGALEMKDETSRHAEYRRVMSSLSLVPRNTARKLFAHLHFLHTMSHANKMGAENLASVWAPTIMPTALTSNNLQTAWSSKEVLVVRDLIANFEAIWEPTEAEKRREAAVRRVLMRVLSNSAPAPHRAAGDLKAWIHVNDRSQCYQVALTPNKTSSDVCIELCEKAKTESHLLMLEEVVCNESMRRIVHIDEIVLDVVLRWGYWDEDDRKDNYLLVRDNKTLQDMDSLRQTTSLVCGEMRFANESMKTFKQHMFELQNRCLCYFKDKQGSQKIEEWNVKDILWYIGHEPKRNPQTRWAITFIPRNKEKRSKEKPWFGKTIAGAVTEDQLKWMSALMFAEHTSILPTPRLVIT
ncbi:arf-GAP with Rho-GAP domain, ANK repeat and PH domain-containing protein 2 [Bombyx mandarina]|uniref:Arf-GAP with Rho-GAP domain, ANK repeat and PH domain-containing protein 2 n=2 Tax=Bombyx TaxID=7090 RepID=A0A8R1WPE0_BOMMO|nr:arf-GAP with Rho-GAP domain, ANK repeat and PH domain-containing protein 2 [Bombyx mori]XP_028034349.1 arf-GAP with Rho-GAP domain, ANK repeat and PH domain-containing protein 2 [Bombyx mandarina]